MELAIGELTYLSYQLGGMEGVPDDPLLVLDFLTRSIMNVQRALDDCDDPGQQAEIADELSQLQEQRAHFARACTTIKWREGEELGWRSTRMMIITWAGDELG